MEMIALLSVLWSFDFGDSEIQLIASLSVGMAAHDPPLEEAKTASHDPVEEAADSLCNCC